jgi:hypothetical protein
MIEKNNNNHSILHNEVNVSPSRPSLFQTLEGVKVQVEYESFGRVMESRATGRKWIQTDPLYNECCLIIAEIYIKQPKGELRIAGAMTEIYIIQEVYRELRHEHIERVVDKFREQGHAIHNKKAYLQTALYNVIFEFDAGTTNDLRACGLIGK